MAPTVWTRAKRAGIGIATVMLTAAAAFMPAGAASAATVQYVPLLPLTAYVNDTVVFGESCPNEVGATCPTGGTGSVSVDGNTIGNLGPSVPYTVNWKATLGSHTVIISFTDATQTQQNKTDTIVVFPRQPSAPQNLTPINCDVTNHCSVGWSAPAQAGATPLTGYQVSLDGGQSQSTTLTSFDVTYVTPGSHTITVAARNSDGTGPSASVNFSRPATSLASAPQNLVGSDGVNANVSWSTPLSDGGSKITQYAVQIDSGNFIYQDAATTSFNVSQVVGIGYGTHTVAVSAVNANGQGAAISKQVIYAIAPAAMTGLVSIIQPANKPLVSLTAPDGHGAPITSYSYYFDNKPSATTILPADTTSFVIAGLSNANHVLHIRASNVYADGQYANYNFQVINPTAPYSPQNLTFDTTGNHLTVKWDPPLLDGGVPVSGYVVSVTGFAPTTISGTTFDMTSFAPGNYIVSVAAKNSVGTGTAADPLNVTRPSVSVPTQITTTGSVGGPAPSLDWATPADDGGQYITGYSVTIDGGTPVVVSGVATTSYIIQTNGLAYGPHTAMVAAINPVGTGPESASISFTYESLPTAPGNVQITSGVAQPVVSWNASTVQGGSIQKYNVYVDGVVAGATADGSTLQYTLAVQTPGVHSVAVTAVSLFSESTQSVGIPFTAPATPDAPTGVSVTSSLDQLIFVSWTQPSVDGGAPVSGYKITVDPATASETSFTVTSSAGGLNVPSPTTFPKGHHTVIVAAVNGVGVGAASDPVGVDVFAPLRITVAHSANPAVGGTVKVFGVAYIGTSTTPAAGEVINLVQLGGLTPTPLASGVTGVDGSYSFNVKVSKTTVMQVQCPGDPGAFLASGTSVTQTVTPRVAASVKATTTKGSRVVKTRVGTKLLFTVSVSAPATGTKVNLQVRLGSGSWKSISIVKISGKSAKAVWTPSKIGKYTVRAIVASRSGYFGGATSSITSVTVTN